MKLLRFFDRRWIGIVLIGLGLWLTSGETGRAAPTAIGVRRINAPFLSGPIPTREMAVAWFGQVTPDSNYADIRVAYNDTELQIMLAIMDRRLWYDESPAPADLTLWDGATIYLDKNGTVGSTLSPTAYRFDAQLNWWENPRTGWQAAYRGNGAGWASAAVAFTTVTGYRWESDTVGGFNNNQNNRGWIIVYHLPFSSLGLSGPPPQGTVWALGAAVHDRDVAATPGADKFWPETLNPTQPVSWGQLRFGVPWYTHMPAAPRGTLVVQHGSNGAVVPDAQVGGWTNCGQNVGDYFADWGAINYAGVQWINVQNQSDIADWPCFARYYVNFPMNVPAGKTIISATVTLRLFGHAGGDAAAPSYIQVLSIDQDWSENTITWNNAPLAQENLGGRWVNPMANPGYPGVPVSWDVSRAAAEAYAAGQPLRLAFYSADSDYHSGRYFYTSDNVDAPVRPILTVTWGDALALDPSAWLPLMIR